MRRKNILLTAKPTQVNDTFNTCRLGCVPKLLRGQQITFGKPPFAPSHGMDQIISSKNPLEGRLECFGGNDISLIYLHVFPVPERETGRISYQTAYSPSLLE
jgi:hypothetical protein